MPLAQSNETRRKKLAVITTTDPKGGQLPRLAQALDSLAVRLEWTVELVVVDDLKQWAAAEQVPRQPFPGVRKTNVRVLWYPENRGQLQAVITGILSASASADAVVTIDPDMYACVDSIPEMLEKLDEGYLLVHGRRRNRPGIGPIRLLGSLITNAMVRTVSGLSVGDIGSPVTLVACPLLKSLSELPAGVTNPRLYLYLRYRDRLTEVLLLPTERAGNRSHYTYRKLAALFLDLLSQSIRTRRSLNQEGLPGK